MKLFILAITVALAAADVSHILNQANSEKEAKIVKQELDVGAVGYNWSYETDNGINARATGSLKNAGSENAAVVVQGEANWVAPNGERVGFQYVADENGYQPQGPLIPTSPPIPEEILRALEYIRQHPPKEQN